MPMPKHKCLPLPYCNPEEGIHCLPNRWFEGKNAVNFQNVIPAYEIIKVMREDDVKPDYWKNIGKVKGAYIRNYGESEPPGFVGYLMWLREKATT